MKFRVIEDADVVTYVMVCDPGDEAVSALAQFARAEDLEAAQITAVGAFERAVVGWFDRAARKYRHIPVDEQCEVLSLIGDVAVGRDGPAAPQRFIDLMGARCAPISRSQTCLCVRNEALTSRDGRI